MLRRNDRHPGPATKVIAWVRNGLAARERFKRHTGRSDLRFHEQDVCDPPPADLRADFIFHAASHASPKHYGADPVGTFRPNVIGTDHLLGLARQSGSERFLFISSSQIYGEVPAERNPIRESEAGAVNPVVLRSCYAEAKRAGETLCVSYLHQYGVPVVIARPFHVYGPGLAPDDGRVYADFIAESSWGRNSMTCARTASSASTRLP